MEVFEWVTIVFSVGTMALAAGAMGYALREATREIEKLQKATQEHSSLIQRLRLQHREIRSSVDRINRKMFGENGPA